MALDSHRRFEILDFEKAFKHLEESCLKERKKETKKKEKEIILDSMRIKNISMNRIYELSKR